MNRIWDLTKWGNPSMVQLSMISVAIQDRSPRSIVTFQSTALTILKWGGTSTNELSDIGRGDTQSPQISTTTGPLPGVVNDQKRYYARTGV